MSLPVTPSIFAIEDVRRTVLDNGLVVLTIGFFAINCQPPWIDDDFSIGLERLAFDARDACRHFELRRRIKNRDGAARDHIENFPLKFIEMRR